MAMKKPSTPITMPAPVARGVAEAGTAAPGQEYRTHHEKTLPKHAMHARGRRRGMGGGSSTY